MNIRPNLPLRISARNVSTARHIHNNFLLVIPIYFLDNVDNYLNLVNYELDQAF